MMLLGQLFISLTTLLLGVFGTFLFTHTAVATTMPMAKNGSGIQVSAETQTLQTSAPHPQDSHYVLGNVALLVAVVKPTASLDFEYTRGSLTSPSEIPMNGALGISFGLSELPLHSLGWNITATHIFINHDQRVPYRRWSPSELKVNSLDRAEGNLAFAITQYFFIKGGLHLSSLNAELINPVTDVRTKPNSSLGYQIGAGVKIHSNVSLYANYYNSRFATDNKSSFNGINTSQNISVDAKSTEFGLAAVF